MYFVILFGVEIVIVVKIMEVQLVLTVPLWVIDYCSISYSFELVCLNPSAPGTVK